MSSLLNQLEAISERREDGGLFHGGHVHFIQNHVSQDGFEDFVLKAGIYGVLENVPNRIPLDLPELVDAGVNYKPSSDFIAAANEINENLLIPLSGFDIVQIVRAAKEYIALAASDNSNLD